MSPPQLRLTCHVQDVGIASAVACRIDHVIVQSSAPELDSEVRRLEATIERDPDAMFEPPEVQGFQTLFDDLGYPRQVPAGRRLVESIASRGFPRYNNLIDAYNIASASHVAGLGMHDAALLIPGSDVIVARAAGEERITPLFKSKSVLVREGDVVYAPLNSRDSPMAWLGKKDVDSDAYKVSDRTQSVFLIALGNKATDTAYNAAVCRETLRLVQLSCPDAAAVWYDTVLERRTSPV